MDDKPEVDREEGKYPSNKDKNMVMTVKPLEGPLQESVLVVTMRDLQLSERYFNGRNTQTESVSMDFDEDIVRGFISPSDVAVIQNKESSNPLVFQKGKKRTHSGF